jgi:hypothetical protein
MARTDLLVLEMAVTATEDVEKRDGRSYTEIGSGPQLGFDSLLCSHVCVCLFTAPSFLVDGGPLSVQMPTLHLSILSKFIQKA